MHLTRRVKQLEELLPTQDYDVQLPDEGDLMGSEMFSQNTAGLAPTLLAWYGEHPQEGQNSTIFLLGRGFNVFETRVVAGGVNVPDAQKRLVSRNVMEIVIPANARVYKHYRVDPHSAQAAHTTGMPNPDPTRALNPDPTRPPNPNPGQPINHPGVAGFNSLRPHNPAGDRRDLNPDPDRPLNPDPTRPLNPDPTKPKQQPCGWAIIDVHIATPNGISNHLYVETDPKPTPQPTNNLVLTATTSTTANPQLNNTTTSTRVEATPPGLALPPLTVLPLGGQLPQFTVLAPGAVTGAPAGSLFPGMTNTPPAPATVPPPVLNPAAPSTGAVPSTPGATSPAAPSTTPAIVPATPPTPAPPVSPAGRPVPTGTSRVEPPRRTTDSILQTSYSPEASPGPQARRRVPPPMSSRIPGPATVVRVEGGPTALRTQDRTPSRSSVDSRSAVNRRGSDDRPGTAATRTASPTARVPSRTAKTPARRSLLDRLRGSNP